MAPAPPAAAPLAVRARVAVAVLALQLLPAALRGDEPEEAGGAPEPPALLEEVSWRDGLRLAFSGEGIPDVDFGDAHVSWARTTGRAALQGSVSERWALGVSLSAELLASDVDDQASFLAPAADDEGGPLRDLFESVLSVGVRRKLGERFTLGADGYLATKLELGAELGDALKGGGAFTLAYRRSDSLSLAFGVKLASRFDRSGVFAWPVLRIEWQISPRLELELRSTDLRLVYAFSDRVDLFVYGRRVTDRYRLERRTSGPLSEEPGTIGVGDANVGIGVLWGPTERWRVAGSAGVVLWERVSVADSSDDRLDEREIQGAAPAVTLRVQRRF
jgi:hypothetical protein